MRKLYTLLLWLLIPFIFFRLAYRGLKSKGYLKRWRQRLGFSPRLSQPSIWLHAVSFGESVAATPIIKRLIEQYPDHPLLITNTTPTGYNHIEKHFGGKVTQCYLPFDIPNFIQRVIRRTKPIIFIVMETELWPNCLNIMNKNNIPSMILNGRLSARSLRRYQKISSISKAMMKSIDSIAAQFPLDADHFTQLGAKPNSVHTTGSIKFDISLQEHPDHLAIKTQLQNRLVWTIASTHDGEEPQVLPTYKALKQLFPNLLMIIAPRHPERFTVVNKLCTKEGFVVTTRSSDQPITPETDVFLGDSMGEMNLFYGLADVVFMGGSFVSTGGHNMLEPISLGKPTITGPYTHNFSSIVQSLLVQKALIQVENTTELTQELQALFQNPEAQTALINNGKQVMSQNKGATDKQLALIAQLLNKGRHE